jgi:hypothetical protein
MKRKQIWECKIGEVDREKLPKGSDLPMRKAVENAYHELTGEWSDYIFSGWDAELDEGEKSFLIETASEKQKERHGRHRR